MAKFYTTSPTGSRGAQLYARQKEKLYKDQLNLPSLVHIPQNPPSLLRQVFPFFLLLYFPVCAILNS